MSLVAGFSASLVTNDQEMLMKEEIRRAVVATAFKLIRGSYPSSLYSYSSGKHTNMGGGYDYDARAHYSNSYHYGN